MVYTKQYQIILSNISLNYMINIFNIYGVSDAVYNYLNMDDILKFVKMLLILSNYNFKPHKFIKQREIEIQTPEQGNEYLNYFQNITFYLNSPTKTYNSITGPHSPWINYGCNLLPEMNLHAFDSIHEYITELNISGISHLTKLSVANYDKHVNDNELKKLTNLQSLDLTSNCLITNDGIKDLVNLTSLKLLCNPTITDDGIKNLTNLKYLHVDNRQGFNYITNNGLKNLTNLISLDIDGARNVTNNELNDSDNLYIYSDGNYSTINKSITKSGLQHLTNLTSLKLNRYR